MSRRLVINRSCARGDVLLVTPILRALREADPSRPLSVQTSYPEVLENNPHIEVAARRVDTSGADVIDLDLAYEIRPRLHIVDAYAFVAGISVRSRRAVVPVDSTSAGRAATLLPEGGRGWAAIHAGPGPWPGRHWAPDRFAAVSSALRTEGWRVFLVGLDASAKIPCDADLRGASLTGLLSASLARAGLFVGVDSFPMHVAAGLGIPGVGIFGAVDPGLRLPGGPSFQGVTAAPHRIWCLGCHHRLPAPRMESGCFRDRPWCMESLEVEDVLLAAERALKVPRDRPG